MAAGTISLVAPFEMRASFDKLRSAGPQDEADGLVIRMIRTLERLH